MLAELSLALRSDVDTLPLVWNVVSRSLLRICRLGKVVTDERIGRAKNLNTTLLGLLQNLESYGEHIGLADRLTLLAALGTCEGVGHTATDDYRVNLLHQLLDDGYLGRHLRATDDSTEWALGVLHNAVDSLKLVLHHVAKHLILGEVVGDKCRRGVCAVRRTEGVVDVAVGIRSQTLNELLLRLLNGLLSLLLLLLRSILGQATRLTLLLGIEAQVLEKHHLTWLKVGSHLSSLLAHTVASEHNLVAEALLDSVDNLLERVLRIGILLRTTEVRHKNHRATSLQHPLNGGNSGTYTCVVCHLTLAVERHVKVYADDGALACEVVVVNCKHSLNILVIR